MPASTQAAVPWVSLARRENRFQRCVSETEYEIRRSRHESAPRRAHRSRRDLLAPPALLPGQQRCSSVLQDPDGKGHSGYTRPPSSRNRSRDPRWSLAAHTNPKRRAKHSLLDAVLLTAPRRSSISPTNFRFHRRRAAAFAEQGQRVALPRAPALTAPVVSGDRRRSHCSGQPTR